MTIKVLVADHGAIRAGLVLILRGAEDIEVVGEAADGATAVRMARTLRPDVALVDVRMPGTDGIEATRQLVADGTCEVLVLTTFDLDEAHRLPSPRHSRLPQGHRLQHPRMAHEPSHTREILTAKGPARRRARFSVSKTIPRALVQLAKRLAGTHARLPRSG